MVTEKKKEVLINKFAIEDSYIFKYAINLPYFLKNAYGINNMYKKLVYKKLERIQKLDTVHSDLFFSTTTKFFRLYIPVNKDMRYRYYAHLYYLFYIKLYRSYRQILGLPSHGQRTRSNANTSFRNNTELKRLVVIKAWQSYPFLTKTYAMTAALAELSNKLWKTNWLFEWRSAKFAIERAKRTNVVKIDLFAMSKFFNRVELGEYKISKKTKQRKKIEKKGSFTTGLELGFSKIYLVKSARELRHVNLQFYYTKTTRLIVEKDTKKSKKRRGGIKLGKGVKSIKVARKMQKKKKKTVWD